MSSFDVLSQAVPMWQGQSQHIKELEKSAELHSKEIFEAEKHFQQETKLTCVLHKRSMALARELHHSQMAHDMEIARREAIRDVWSQRSRFEENLMVVATLMFACTFSLLVEGSIAGASPRALVVVYGGSAGVSLGLLFISIWFALNLHTRMGKYELHRPHTVYTCGKTHHNFNDYYDCHCRKIAHLTLGTFYTGTALCLLCAALYAFQKFYYTYNDSVSAIAFGVIIGIVMLIIPFGEFVWPSSTRAGEEDYGGLAGGDLTDEIDPNITMTSPHTKAAREVAKDGDVDIASVEANFSQAPTRDPDDDIE